MGPGGGGGGGGGERATPRKGRAERFALFNTFLCRSVKKTKKKNVPTPPHLPLDPPLAPLTALTP